MRVDWSTWRTATVRGDCVFFVGAGISADPPSRLPLAPGLVSRMVRSGAERCDLPETLINRCQAHLRRLRPEVLADIIVHHLGPTGLGSINEVLQGSPNAWHVRLADAIRRGCTVITTNFDTLIEQACASQGVAYTRVVAGGRSPSFERYGRGKPAGQLIKIHGSLPWKGRFDGNLALALRDVARGLPGRLRTVTNDLLADRPLVVLGYAGRDDFDIRDLLLSLDRRGQTLWVVHDSSRSGLQPIRGQEKRWIPAAPAFQYARNWSGPTLVLRGQTGHARRVFPTAPKITSKRSVTSRPYTSPNGPAPTAKERLAWRRALVYSLLEARSFALALDVLRNAPIARLSLRSRTRLLIDEAVVLEKQGHGLDAAAAAAEMAIKLARETGSASLLVNALDQRGVIFRRGGKDSRAERRYRAALEILSTVKHSTDLEIRVRAHRAVALEYLKRYRLAIDEHSRVLDAERRRGDLRGAAKTLSNMAIVHAARRDVPRAEALFRESIALKTLLGDVYGIAASLQGIGRMHYYQGDKTIAEEAFRRSYKLRIGTARDPHGAAQALIGIGRIALDRGDYDEAEAAGTESLNTMIRINDERGIEFARGLLNDIANARRTTAAA